MTKALLPTYARTDVIFKSGKGCELIAEDGTRYIDFGAGIAVNALGHAHPHMVEALKAQADKLWHVSNLYHIAGQERLAERLVEASFADKVFFANSGVEANECAVKMARKYHYAKGKGERYRVVTFEGGFHGRTLAMIAAGGKEAHLEGFGPKVDGFDHVPVGDIDALKNAINEETAALMIEPIQGEGGIHVIDPAFLKALRAIADEHDIVLIFDEVQTGVGRTGYFYAYEGMGVEPDILTSAKGLGGGFPVGACLARDKYAEAMSAGSHGSTFGGNPLAMAAANAVLDVVLAPDFLPQVREMGLLFKQKLAALVDENSDIFSLVRGEGLLIGLECVAPAADVITACFKERLLCVGAGGNVIRLLPPLIAEQADLDQAIECLAKAAQNVRQG